MTRGATEITPAKRILVTVALLILAPVVMVGGSIANNAQKQEAARIAAEEARRVAEETAKKVAEEQARILEAQVRAAEENARVLEAQARAAEGRAAASYDAHARAEAKELARIEMLRAQCESWGGREPAGPATLGSIAVLPLRLRGIQYCDQYEQAVKERQYYDALRRQGR
jgi:hypothetical protein